MKKIDDSIKFAWAFLLFHGKILTSGKWNYYGGFDKATYGFDYNKNNSELAKIKDKAISIGIDWDKSGVPKVDNEATFNGTFNSNSCYTTITRGKLVLNNGETYLLGSSDDEAAHLAEAARQLRKGNSEIMNLASKL